MKQEYNSLIINVKIQTNDLDGCFIILLNEKDKKFFIYDGKKGNCVYKDKFLYLSNKEISGQKGIIPFKKVFSEEEFILDNNMDKKQKENRLKDFLEKIIPEKLPNILNTGKLILMKREFSLKSGIVDFLYIDKINNIIILIEVKVDDIGLPELRQIISYRNDLINLNYNEIKSVIIGKKVKKSAISFQKNNNITFIPLSLFDN